MKTDLTFRNLSPRDCVPVQFDDVTYDLPLGENLAAALLSVGVTSFRNTPVSNSPRGPFCMMGACFDCQVSIDGVITQACMTQVAENMVIRRPNYEAWDDL